MNFISIQELQDNHPLKVEHTISWLAENENYFYFLINESNCRKWSKWVEDKTIQILPCCCPVREQDCILIETYYKLEKIVELHNNENYFKAIIQDYKIIAKNKEQVSEWYKKYQNIASKLAFDTEISIMLELKQYKNEIIQLNENEFKNTIELQNIFNELEYNSNLRNCVKALMVLGMCPFNLL